MYHDVFIEESIKRGTPTVAKVCNVILIVITILVALQFVFVSYGMFGIPLMVMIVLCYFVIQNTKIEFDYTYTNGLLEITKIKGRNKRKELLSCEMKDVVVIAPSKTEPVQPYIGSRMKTFDCISHTPGVPYYTMIVKEPDGQMETKVLFEPSEEMLDAMYMEAPRRVYKKV
jgi:hypothetical protein